MDFDWEELHRVHQLVKAEQMHTAPKRKFSKRGAIWTEEVWQRQSRRGEKRFTQRSSTFLASTVWCRDGKTVKNLIPREVDFFEQKCGRKEASCEVVCGSPTHIGV